jgi:hypothetical protein
MTVGVPVWLSVRYQNCPWRSKGGSVVRPAGRANGRDDNCLISVVSVPSGVSRSAQVLIPHRLSWDCNPSVSGGPVINWRVVGDEVGVPPRLRYSSERARPCSSPLI